MARAQHHDRTDKLAEAHDRLAHAVEALVSGDDWQTFLTMAAKLHGYSANNVLLILSQAPWACQVAGYRTWQQLGRQVRAGEKGIAILAPVVRRTRVKDEATGDETVVTGSPSAFRIAHIFDVVRPGNQPCNCSQNPLSICQYDIVKGCAITFLRPLDELEVNQHAVDRGRHSKIVASCKEAHRQICRLQGFAGKGKK